MIKATSPKAEWFGLALDSAEPLGPFATSELAVNATILASRRLALDRAPDNRFYDLDGHLHIRKTRISKANVCPYRGKEIPNFEELGLEPEKIYQLYRSPEELAKGASSFNNKPILSEHIPITADEPNRDHWAGCLGNDASFEAPYLYNSLAVWDKPSIEGVEDDSKRELSAGYRYRADMTPGEIGGIRFDGVMRDIVGNHVAFVEEGRAGADVMAADAALKTTKGLIQMKSTALTSRKALLLAGAALGALSPKLAQDAKLDLSPAFKGVTAKNFKDKKPAISAGIKTALDGKLKTGLALDAEVEDVMRLLDACEGAETAGVDEVPATMPSSAVPLKTGEAIDEDPEAKRREFLAGKLSAEDMSAYDEMCPAKKLAGDADETPEEKAAREKKEKDDKAAADAKAAKDKAITPAAMDAALANQRKSILTTQREIREAEKAVFPRVGELTIAADSAADVYGAALDQMGIKRDGVPKEGLRALFEAIPVPEARRQRDDSIAMDGAAQKSFGDRFPGADRIALAS